MAAKLSYIIAAMLMIVLLLPTLAMAQVPPTKTLYAVVINGETLSQGTFFLCREDQIFVNERDLRQWRFAPPKKGIFYKGEKYYPITAMAGLKYSVDVPSQTLKIDAPIGLFAPAIIDAERAVQREDPSYLRGFFLNYDLSLQGSDKKGGQMDGLFELVIPDPLGATASSFKVGDLGKSNNLIRLETLWNEDDLDKMESYRVGDIISSSGTMGRSFRMGGIQWATNFGTRPGFVSYPAAVAIGGTAELPSTVDIYVNNVRIFSRQVPAGPFEIRNFPVTSGSGEIKLVVKDLLGREHLVTQTYLTSPRLLKAGLTDFSYEAGLERRNYGIASNDYGSFILAGTHRHGFTDFMTGETHFEGAQNQQILSFASLWLLPDAGIATAGIGGRTSDAGVGVQGMLGYDFIASDRMFNVGANMKLFSKEYRELDLSLTPIQFQGSVHINKNFSRYGVLGLSYTHRDFFGQPGTRAITGSYDVNFWSGSLNLSVYKSMDATLADGFNFMYSLPLENNQSIAETSSVQNNQSRHGIEYQKNFESSTGYAYRLRGEKGDGQFAQFQANIAERNPAHDLGVNITGNNSQSAYQINFASSIVAVEAGLFLTRRINQSFGLVALPDFSNVEVYVNKHSAGKTNAQGYLIAADLRPYESNIIELNPLDLPITIFGDYSAKAVPYYRSGTLINFDIENTRNLMLTIKTADGKPLPAGSILKNRNGPGEWPVAEDGRAYVNGLRQDKLALIAMAGSRTCTLRLDGKTITQDWQPVLCE